MLKQRFYRTAKTARAIGAIAANTYVRVEYAYTEGTTGRHVFTIQTKLFGGLVEHDVLEEHLTDFCL